MFTLLSVGKESASDQLKRVYGFALILRTTFGEGIFFKGVTGLNLWDRESGLRSSSSFDQDPAPH